MGVVLELGFYRVAALGASALGAMLAHGQTWRCRDVPSAGSLPAVGGIEEMQRGRPCAVGHPSPQALLSVDPYPDVIDLWVFGTFCSSEAASILGLTACFLALRVCFYYKQQSALQGSLYKIMIHLIWKHFFHFFPTFCLI